VDPNLLASHIICLDETRIQNIIIHLKKFTKQYPKNNNLSCYNEHGTMILYDKMFILSNTTSTRNADAEFIYAGFNQNTREVIHVITIYKPPKMRISYFISILKKIWKRFLLII
jgi:hypothetical protein